MPASPVLDSTRKKITRSGLRLPAVIARRLDGTEWRQPVSGTEVRPNRGTTAVGAGYPPRIGLRSSAASVSLFVVRFARNTRVSTLRRRTVRLPIVIRT